jgi:hypothetical protein
MWEFWAAIIRSSSPFGIRRAIGVVGSISERSRRAIVDFVVPWRPWSTSTG